MAQLLHLSGSWSTIILGHLGPLCGAADEEPSTGARSLATCPDCKAALEAGQHALASVSFPGDAGSFGSLLRRCGARLEEYDVKA